MKKCSKCNIEKDISLFPKRYDTKNGVRGTCIECTKKWYSIWTDKNRDKINEQYRGYNKLPKYRTYKKEWMKKARKTQKYIEVKKATESVRYRKQIKDIKTKPCFVCGNTKVEGHHENYDRPLDVMWLCLKHHRQLHRSKNEAYRNYGNIMPVNNSL